MEQLELDFSQHRCEIVDEGENQFIAWYNTLSDSDCGEIVRYHDDIYIKDEYDEYDESEYWIDIKKKDLGKYTFEQLLLFLKNIENAIRIIKFKKFLDNRNIKYKEDNWQSINSAQKRMGKENKTVH